MVQKLILGAVVAILATLLLGPVFGFFVMLVAVLFIVPGAGPTFATYLGFFVLVVICIKLTGDAFKGLFVFFMVLAGIGIILSFIKNE